MARERSYTDKQLVEAITASSSWRGTLRELGLAATSAGAMRSVRSQAKRIGIDYSHFTGQRRWTEEHLRTAISTLNSWTEVASDLGLDSVSAVARVKGHAARLGLDVAHLTVQPAAVVDVGIRPHIANLDRAGPLLAAAWFTLCGHDVSWPLEPCRYDLLVSLGDRIRRVQVKTTTVHVGDTWKVYLSTTRRERRTYDPDEIDNFFIIDGNHAYYLIPVAAVGGLDAIHLRAYDQYRVAQIP